LINADEDGNMMMVMMMMTMKTMM